MNGNMCHVCGHTIDYHGHTQEITEEVEETKYEETLIEVQKTVTNENKVQLKQLLEQNKDDISHMLLSKEEQL